MKKKNFNTINCYGCNAVVEDIVGQAHKYIGATQGCWNLYGEVLAKEYMDYEYFEHVHRLTVDTYAVQHPGEPGKQSIQSVNIHLISLYAVLIKNLTGKEATKMIDKILAKKPEFEWLEPPIPNGQITVKDVAKAISKENHKKVVKDWAVNVFDCWYSKHKTTIEKNVKLYFEN